VVLVEPQVDAAAVRCPQANGCAPVVLAGEVAEGGVEPRRAERAGRREVGGGTVSSIRGVPTVR
jgi:hypothetical protein